MKSYNRDILAMLLKLVFVECLSQACPSQMWILCDPIKGASAS